MHSPRRALAILAVLACAGVAQQPSLPRRTLLHAWVRGDPVRHDGWILLARGDTVVIQPEGSHGAWHVMLAADTMLASQIDSAAMRVGRAWYTLHGSRDDQSTLGLRANDPLLSEPGTPVVMSSTSLGWNSRRGIVRGAGEGDSLKVALFDSVGVPLPARMVAPSSLDQLSVRLLPSRSRGRQVWGGFLIGEKVAAVLFASAAVVLCSQGSEPCGDSPVVAPFVFVPLGVVGAIAGAAAPERPETWIAVHTRE